MAEPFGAEGITAVGMPDVVCCIFSFETCVFIRVESSICSHYSDTAVHNIVFIRLDPSIETLKCEMMRVSGYADSKASELVISCLA